MADEQCAVNPVTGELMDAADIEGWRFSPTLSDSEPPSASDVLKRAATVAQESDMPHSKRRRTTAGSRMQAAILEEQLGSDGEKTSKYREKGSKKHRKASKSKKKRKKNAPIDGEDLSDADDSNFKDTSSDGESSSGASDVDSDIVEITNAELADVLPTKTKSGPSKKRTLRARVEEVEDEDSPRRQSARAQSPVDPAVVIEPTPTAASGGRKKNPIHYFYKLVPTSASGSAGAPADRHYKCYHGNKKVLTITAAMKYNLTTLVTNLRGASPLMFKLYEWFKANPTHTLTQEDIDVASGQKELSPEQSKRYWDNLSTQSGTLEAALKKQAEAAIEPWDQDRFEQLLAEWLVACDQPFEEVDRPELRDLLEYIHHNTPGSLKIPHRDAIKRRVMKMGEDTVESIKEMFRNDVPGKVNISLDAWTSSNNYAFLAIVAHYITKDGNLEELLIDFAELIGEHSGENMAMTVWKTLKQYGLEHKIFTFMLDNASNNDTMLTAIESLAHDEGIEFNSKWARLRCMPHTIHLAAVKLLEAIGAVSKSEAHKALSRAGNYQETTTAPLEREHDDPAAALESTDLLDSLTLTVSASSRILPAVEKLRKIIRAIRASPQRKQAWFKTITDSLREKPARERLRVLMLILDVRTQWSSTHQMLRRALDYSKEIDRFVSLHKDLRGLELDKDDWSAIALVSGWLKVFRSATTEMSRTKQPMLSHVHASFRGVQEHVEKALRELPDSAPPQLKTGLLEAHAKLSEYYGKTDDSPYYAWAALLDPRIMYEGLHDDWEHDPSLLADLETAKEKLSTFYTDYYAPRPVLSNARVREAQSSQSSTSGPTSPEKVDLTKQYKKQRAPINEIEEYFKLKAEDYGSCNPLQWWLGRKCQFPHLYRLACDILSIPGSAVAVERIFSGGRDTISLRRSSLAPKTIRVLMLVKQRLRLARAAALKEL